MHTAVCAIDNTDIDNIDGYEHVYSIQTFKDY